MLSMVRRLRAEQKRPMEPIQTPEQATAPASEAAPPAPTPASAATNPAPASAATNPAPASAATNPAPVVAPPDPALPAPGPEHAMSKPAMPAGAVPHATLSNRTRLNAGVAAVSPIPPPLAAIGRVPPLAPFARAMASQG